MMTEKITTGLNRSWNCPGDFCCGWRIIYRKTHFATYILRFVFLRNLFLEKFKVDRKGGVAHINYDLTAN